MNYQYFVPIPKTAEELKKEYRRLGKIHHPDCGGTNEAMKAINAEYTVLFEKIGNIFTNATGENYTKETTETPEDFINIINQIIGLDDIVIEIIGSFVWISGNTYPHKDIIKSLDFKWSRNKSAWYLPPDGYRPRSRKDYSMDDIRNMYGSQEIKASANKTYKKYIA